VGRPSRFGAIRCYRTIGGKALDAILPLLEFKQNSMSELESGRIKSASKNIAIVASFNENVDEVRRIVQTINEVGYEVLVINNGSLTKAHGELYETQNFFERRNMGYDFGAYRDSMRLFEFPRNLILMNTSMIWDHRRLARIIHELTSLDLEGRVTYLTESLQGSRHGQSFFIHINVNKTEFSKLKTFLLTKTKNWRFKRSVVKFGEKALFDFFESVPEIQIEFLFPYKEVERSYMLLSEADSEAWIKSHLKKNVKLNPTQHLWPALKKLGFPGIKKTLIKNNPAKLEKIPIPE
jgi:hypothetical protein